MNNDTEEVTSEDSKPQKNNWNLILGIMFLLWGSYRMYQHLYSVENDTFGIVLAAGFIAFGIYDLYKYFRGV